MDKTLPVRSAAQLLVDQLLLHGADHAFCVPGESYLAVLDALYEAREQIHLTVNRQEAGAAFMAEAYGKLTGRPGICLVTRGPGATNAAIGVHTAFQDSTPMILLIGQVGSDFVEREAFQEIDYRRMFGPMAKWVAQIDRSDRIPEFLSRAFHTATSGRPGPVVLALPEDLLTESTQSSHARRYQIARAAPDPSLLTQLAVQLAQARRPLIIAGGAGWTAAGCAELEAFSNQTAIAVACSFRRQDLFDNHHEHYAGDVGIAINPKLAQRIRDADLILAVGTRLGEMTTSGYTLFDIPVPRQFLVHVYPSPEELGRVVTPHLALHADVNLFCTSLRQLPLTTNPAWRDQTREARSDYEAWQREPQVYSQRPLALNLWQCLGTLFARLPSDVLLANGAGNFATWGHRFHRYPGFALGVRSQLAPASGAMGYGVPAGIAGKIVSPERTVVVLTGDGDFLMTGQELATAVHERAAILILLVNNGMYGTIRMHQAREYPGRIYGTSLSNPDFAALARAYGAFGAKVTRTQEFAPRLEEALAHIASEGTPALLELMTDPAIVSPSMVLAPTDLD